MDESRDIRDLERERWGSQICEAGMISIPALLLDYMAQGRRLTDKDQKIILRVLRHWDLEQERWPTVSIQVLSDELHISTSAIHKSIRRLVQRGLVGRAGKPGRIRCWDLSGLLSHAMQHHLKRQQSRA